MAAIRFLQAGDQVIHPRFGFGIVETRLTPDPGGASVEYYNVRLSDGGLLSVPIARAESVGLRRLVNGVAATVAFLRARMTPLPQNARLRVAELMTRWESPEPAALAGGVRDLVGYARQFDLTAGDKKWLARACERLSAEAARVDAIEPDAARAAITTEVERLKAR